MTSFVLTYAGAGATPFNALSSFYSEAQFEREASAPEGTPLSKELCERLHVPIGTLWGAPAGSKPTNNEIGDEFMPVLEVNAQKSKLHLPPKRNDTDTSM
mmetsp:Transcript_84762/g.226239  ORF Transcript_84762/g.226239 Transcript_84762/m.226239 type:complete len:100 (-) Transcript_84762:146-445(-)